MAQAGATHQVVAVQDLAAQPDAARGSPPTGGKGKGRGKGKAPPAPAVIVRPKATATPGLPPKRGAPTGGPSGMTALLAKVQDVGKEMDKNNALEMDNVDVSGIDADAKGEQFECPRCHKLILCAMRESHMSAHSAEILPWLFLGASRNADNGKELTERTGITHILNVAHEVNQDHDAREQWHAYNDERGLPREYKKFPWYDMPDQDIIKEMSGPIDFLVASRRASDKHRVLVHCVQGISRSASVVICYLMQHEGTSLREAYQRTKLVRPVVEPRREFLDQLGRYECHLFGIEKPTLMADEVYAGKFVLQVDHVAPIKATGYSKGAVGKLDLDGSSRETTTSCEGEVHNAKPMMNNFALGPLIAGGLPLAVSSTSSMHVALSIEARSLSANDVRVLALQSLASAPGLGEAPAEACAPVETEAAESTGFRNIADHATESHSKRGMCGAARARTRGVPSNER